MERIHVQSSTIKSIGYDGSQFLLEIEFLRGVIYQYTGISKELFNEFSNTESKGSFLSKEIMKNYPFKKIYDSKEEKK